MMGSIMGSMMGWALAVACAPRPTGPSLEALSTQVRPALQVRAEGSPVTWLEVRCRAGSAFDPPDGAGTAWLAAHLVAEGGGAGLDADALRGRLHAWGTRLEVDVDREQVALRLAVVSELAEEAATLLGGVVAEPAWHVPTFERLVDQARATLLVGLPSDAEALGQAVLDRALHEGHPYAWPEVGRIADLDRATLDGVRAWKEQAWGRRSCVAGVAGPSPELPAAALARALESLPAIPWGAFHPGSPLEGPVPPATSTPAYRPRPRGLTLLAVQADVEGTGLHLGHPLDVDRNHPDWPALVAGMTVLGNHRESWGRLFRGLRGDRGLTYGAYAYAEPFNQLPGTNLPSPGAARLQGRALVWVRPVANESAPFALRFALDALAAAARDGVTGEELDVMREHLVARVPMWAMDPGLRLGWATEAALLGQADPLERLPREVPLLTEAEVDAALARHLTPEHLVIVAVTADPAGLLEALREGGPTPAVYGSAGAPAGSAVAADDARIAALPVTLAASGVSLAQELWR